MDEAAFDALCRNAGLQADEVELVRSLRLFAGLDVGTVAALLRHARTARFPRGAVLFSRGDPADRFFVILDGWVKLSRQTSDGHESVIGLFTRGDSFAEAATFEEGEFPVDGVVVEEARLLVVPAAPFLAWLRRHPEIAFNMMASLSRHMRALVEKIEQLTTRTATERLAGFIVGLCDARESPARLRLPLDKVLIAGRLGMQPETLSRALTRLREHGVHEAGGEFLVDDVDHLRRLSEGQNGRPPGCPRL